MTSQGRLSLFVSLALLAGSATASAQELQWLRNYSAAQAQAKELQRPMVLDFGTANCYWCRRLEATTFRDPGVMKTLSEYFVAVKIDADREPQLAQKYGVNAYPTLVFLAPDGRLIGKHEGYVEVARFNLQLERALRDSVPAERPALLTRRTTPVATVEPKRAAEATRLLGIAQDDYRAGQYFQCLARCRQIIETFAETAAEPEAQRLAADIKADPEKARQVRVALANSLGDLYLSGAETALKEGRLHAAEALLERVQHCSPDTPYAHTAKVMLEKLRARPVGENEPAK
jgi:thiol-disulfide isomerase/thioredoxin